jgi:hypothetical protein
MHAVARTIKKTRQLAPDGSVRALAAFITRPQADNQIGAMGRTLSHHENAVNALHMIT